MIYRYNCIFLILYVFTSLPVYAYEINTHGFLTNYAFKLSVLNAEDSPLNDFGIENSANPLGRGYYDVDDQSVVYRYNRLFEDMIIRDEILEAPLSIQGWLMRGTIREDDCAIPGVCDNPYITDGDASGVTRPFNHFFDPVNNEKLGLGEYSAPNWTLGTLNAFPIDGQSIQPLPTNLIKNNNFTMFDAREAQYRALTGQTVDGLKTEPGGIYPTNVSDVTEPMVRDAYWATVFRIIGDMVHLVQDMGQPQHTRLDTHSTADRLDRPVYEAYLNARATGAEYDCFNGPKRPMPGLNYTLSGGQAYPIPEFDQYGHFFSTIQTTGRDVLVGKGLADYSNRGFFTAGTNIGSGTSFKYPSASGVTAIEENYLDDCLQQYPAKFTLLKGTVTDQQVTTQTANNVPLSAKALWDLPNIDLDFPDNILPKYTLVKENYDAMADLLLPRAVAYSAGFINYFFRPRIALIRDVTNPNNYRIRNKHKMEAMDGKFELFYEDMAGIKHPIVMYTPGDLTKTAVTQLIIPPDTGIAGDPESLSQLLTFDLPQEDPIKIDTPQMPKTNYKFTLVFRGKMGNEEDAVAGKEVCLPWDIGSGAYHMLAINCDHKVWAWGGNVRSQLGSPVLTEGKAVARPVPVAEPLDPAAAELFRREKFDVLVKGNGSNSSFALSSTSGNLWGWGNNVWGQLLHESVQDQGRPILVMADVKAVDAGFNVVVIKNDDLVFNWGLGTNGSECPFTDRVGGIPINPCEFMPSFSYPPNPEINSWWEGGYYTVSPLAVDTLPGPATAIAAGEFASMAVVGGSVYVWGARNYWMDTDVSYDNREPLRIPFLTAIKKIQIGRWHAIALDTAGTVWSFPNRYHTKDFGTMVYRYIRLRIDGPYSITGIGNVVDIITTEETNVTLNDQGEVYVWGGNRFGEHGNGTKVPELLDDGRFGVPKPGTHCTFEHADVPHNGFFVGSCGFTKPLKIQGIGRIVKITGGCCTIMAMEEDGTLWTWGLNHLGQAGVGLERSKYTMLKPVRVLPLK